MIQILPALLLLLTSISSSAQMRFTVPSDLDYFISDDGSYRFIYSAAERELMPELKKYNLLFKQIYEKEFRWVFDEKATLILASNKNQIANGFATTLPRLHTVYYGGGAEIIDEFSVGSWLYTLLSHETAHLYQLNIKHGYAQKLKDIFGASDLSGMSFLPPFTFTEHSNAFLPTFLLEGNATFNEGRFGNGGRLYSGASRALLLQLAKAGEITPTKLMNDHIGFPFGREKYLVGGFFFLDLARRNSSDKANLFFNNHAHYKFNPFLINAPFFETFNVSYQVAVQQLVEYWRPLFEAQKTSSEKPIFTSLFHGGFTSDSQEIRLLTGAAKRPPVARLYNLKSHKWTERQVNMPLGKLFRDSNQKLVSTSSEPVSNHEIRAGLFGENYSFSKKDLNRYYYDIRGDQKLWANAKSSFLNPDLYVNTGDHLGRASSSGIIGDDDKAYFFTQTAKRRTLVRGGTPLFSFQGYYGFPIGASSERVYFIGPVARGSSVFYWSNGEFYRALESDTVIDARIINDSSAVVAEITASGYEYKIVQLKPKKESPFEYTYFTENEPHSRLLVKNQEKQTEPVNTDFKMNEKAYSSLSNWQFDGIDPFVFFGSDVPAVAQFIIRFSDPLQDHALQLLLSSGSYGEYAAGFQYINSKYVVNWDVLALFAKKSTVKFDDDTQKGEVLDRYDSWLAATGFSYPIYRRSQWEVLLSSHFVYQNEDPSLPKSDIDKKYTVLTDLNISNVVSAPLAYSSYKLFNLDIANEYIRTAPDWNDQRNIYGGEFILSRDLYKETYLSSSYQAAYTDSPFPVVLFENSPDDFPYSTPTHVYRNTRFKDKDYFEVRKLSAQLKQAFNYSLYFTKFPLSLRRFAVFAEYNEYYGATTRNTDPNTLFHEAGGGVELELLLIHKLPFRAKWSGYKSSYDSDASSIFILGANKQF